MKFCLLLLFLPLSVFAEAFSLPVSEKDSVVGEVTFIPASSEETLLDVARRFDIGNDEIVSANPSVNRWVPDPGRKLVIPSRHILPDGPREGIVLNVGELRLYYFPPRSNEVFTFPVSIGRMDWKTPLGKTKVVKKEKDPPWIPTESIREEHMEEDDYLPKMIPGGSPENPLGHYALRLGVPGYLIHGTDERKSFGIGMRVTHGCVRMYPEDIEKLYEMVPVGTPVYIVNAPAKAAWEGDKLYLEIHRPPDPDEQEAGAQIPFDEVLQVVQNKANGAIIDEGVIRKVYEHATGIPEVVASSANLYDHADLDEGREPSDLLVR